MPDEFARAVHELVRDKVEKRAPEIEVSAGKETPAVIKFMAALKESVRRAERRCKR